MTREGEWRKKEGSCGDELEGERKKEIIIDNFLVLPRTELHANLLLFLKNFTINSEIKEKEQKHDLKKSKF